MPVPFEIVTEPSGLMLVPLEAVVFTEVETDVTAPDVVTLTLPCVPVKDGCDTVPSGVKFPLAVST